MTLYPGYPGQPYYPPPRPRQTNGWAVAALVSAFIFPPAAIVCGHVSLVQLKRRDEDGRGMAIAGLVLGYLLTVLVAIGVALLIWFMMVLDQSFNEFQHRYYGTYATALTSDQGQPATRGPLPLTGV